VKLGYLLLVVIALVDRALAKNGFPSIHLQPSN
jgi:hypothetical protein